MVVLHQIEGSLPRGLLGAMVVLALGCDDARTVSDEPLWPPLAIGVVEPAIVLPGTRLRIFAAGLVPPELARYEATLSGLVDGRPIEVRAPATVIAPELLEVPLELALADALAGETGVFSGALAVRRVALDATGVAETVATRPLELPLRRTLAPVALGLSTQDLFLGETITVLGDGFLLPGEGTTLVRFDGVFTSDVARPIEGLVVPAITSDPERRVDPREGLGRGALSFSLTPDVFGVRPGRFTGTVSVVDAHLLGDEIASSPLAVGTLSLRPPVLTAVSPTAASRGQLITIHGHGLVPADGLAQTATVLLLEGVFSPRRGVPEAYDGVSAIVIYPDISDGGTRATAVLRVGVGDDGSLTGLGANAGTFAGTLTPLVLAGPDAIEGPPLSLTFEVRAPRQVVHIRFLPGFSDALVRFGLLAEREAIERRILEVLERDYAGVNIAFTFNEPTDFAEYSVVEVGGRDPNGTQLFGLDNTVGKDVGNLRFDDVIGGFNAETREQNFAAYGGIFASELLNLSPTLGRSELASPRFDDVFGEVVPELGGHAARVGESHVFDARGVAIVQAVRVLGNLIGSTITHEVAHSLGMTAIEGRYHNEGDTPNWIMDAGQFRPFEERAEIDGFGPAVFEPFNRDYLLSILPPDAP